jgi:hypothetical protein
MSMRQKLKRIMGLQQIGADIRQDQRDKEALYIDVRQQKRQIQDLQEELEATHAQRLQCQKEADGADLKAREAGEHVARLRVQLNTTKSQDDFDALRQSIQSHKADISHWEDRGLELIDQAEQLQEEERQLQEKLDQEKQKLEELKKSVSDQAETYDSHIAELEAESESLRQEADPKALAAYDRLVESRGDSAIVSVCDRVCQGCYNLITKQTENMLLHDQELVTCPSCGRILMLAD